MEISSSAWFSVGDLLPADTEKAAFLVRAGNRLRDGQGKRLCRSLSPQASPSARRSRSHRGPAAVLVIILLGKPSCGGAQRPVSSRLSTRDRYVPAAGKRLHPDEKHGVLRRQRNAPSANHPACLPGCVRPDPGHPRLVAPGRPGGPEVKPESEALTTFGVAPHRFGTSSALGYRPRSCWPVRPAAVCAALHDAAPRGG